MVDLMWWDKFLFGFSVSLIITGVKHVILAKDNQENNDNAKVNKDSKDSNDSKYNNNNNKNNNNRLDYKTDNNLDNKKVKFIKNFINNFIKKFIFWLFIYLVMGLGFGYFSSIYCEPTDSVSNNSGENNKDNKIDSGNNVEKGKEKAKTDDYTISASVAKGIVKEAVEGAVEGISKVVPTVVGGFVGGSLGVAAIKHANSLPPVQKAMLGVGTAVIGAFGVNVATGLGKSVVTNASKSTGAESSVSGSNISSSTGAKGENVKDFIIPSIFEKELSPLETILNSEIILCVLILVHMCFIILIGLHKLYISYGLNIISKLLSKNLAEKYANFKKKIENIGTMYLIILIIINVILILFYIFMLIYANVELSNNIDAFIEVHLKMKKGAIMLLLVKSNFIEAFSLKEQPPLESSLQNNNC